MSVRAISIAVLPLGRIWLGQCRLCRCGAELPMRSGYRRALASLLSSINFGHNSLDLGLVGTNILTCGVAQSAPSTEDDTPTNCGETAKRWFGR